MPTCCVRAERTSRSKDVEPPSAGPPAVKLIVPESKLALTPSRNPGDMYMPSQRRTSSVSSSQYRITSSSPSSPVLEFRSRSNWRMIRESDGSAWKLPTDTRTLTAPGVESSTTTEVIPAPRLRLPRDRSTRRSERRPQPQQDHRRGPLRRVRRRPAGGRYSSPIDWYAEKGQRVVPTLSSTRARLSTSLRESRRWGACSNRPQISSKLPSDSCRGAADRCASGWKARRSPRLRDRPSRSGTTFLAGAIGSLPGFVDWRGRAGEGCRSPAGGPRSGRGRSAYSARSPASPAASAGGPCARWKDAATTSRRSSRSPTRWRPSCTSSATEGTSCPQPRETLAPPPAGESRRRGYRVRVDARFWVEPERRDEFESVSDARRAAWAWRRYVSAARTMQPPAFEVRYEELAADPHSAARELAKHMNAPETQLAAALARATTPRWACIAPTSARISSTTCSPSRRPLARTRLHGGLTMLSTERIARSSARHPWLTLGAWLIALVLAIATIVAMLDLTSKASHVDPESERGDQLLGEHFPPDPAAEFVNELISCARRASPSTIPHSARRSASCSGRSGRPASPQRGQLLRER